MAFAFWPCHNLKAIQGKKRQKGRKVKCHLYAFFGLLADTLIKLNEKFMNSPVEFFLFW